MADAAGHLVEKATYCAPGDEKRPSLVGLPDFTTQQVCPEELSEGVDPVTDAYPDGWYVRVVFDELLDPSVEELTELLDDEDMPSGTFEGSIAGTHPVTLRCQSVSGAMIDVSYDGYYSPSGNAVTWPVGPSLVIKPNTPTLIATNTPCTVTLNDNVFDKDGELVPSDQRGPFNFSVAPIQPIYIYPEDDDSGDGSVDAAEIWFDNVYVQFNTFVDPGSLCDEGAAMDECSEFNFTPEIGECSTTVAPCGVDADCPSGETCNSVIGYYAYSLVPYGFTDAEFGFGPSAAAQVEKSYTFSFVQGSKVKDRCGVETTFPAPSVEEHSLTHFTTNPFTLNRPNIASGETASPLKRIQLLFSNVVDATSVETTEYSLMPAPTGANAGLGQSFGTDLIYFGYFNINTEYTFTLNAGATVADYWGVEYVQENARTITWKTAPAITLTSTADNTTFTKASATSTVGPTLTFNSYIKSTNLTDPATRTTTELTEGTEFTVTDSTGNAITGFTISTAGEDDCTEFGTTCSIRIRKNLPAGTYTFTLKTGATATDELNNTFTQPADKVIHFVVKDPPPPRAGVPLGATTMLKQNISKVLMAAALGTLVVTGSSLIEDQSARAQGSAGVGGLRGTVRDKAGGAAAVGATVVATSPALQGEQVVITDDTGQYFLTSLPPGVYTLTVYYTDATFSRGNVLIQIGKEAVVNLNVDTGAATGKPKGEVITIAGTAPIVDQGSTKTGLTITDDYTRNVPVARTFGGVVGQAAGAQGDNYGISFAGATSVENVYIVEGINTTDTAYGGLSSNLPNEFISETEVITGGYNAEFGRATGGIVNVVTKQGSNEFHGSVFGYFQPGGFVAGANPIRREGSSIDTETNLDFRYDLGAELGGPIVKDKVWFHVGFNPSFTQYTTTRFVGTQVDRDGMPGPDKDPETDFTIHETVAQSEIPRDFKTYFFTAKINAAVNANNQFQLSAFGNPRSATDTYTVTRNPSQILYDYDDGAYDVAAKWTSKFGEGKTQIDAVVGYHHGYVNEQPHFATQEVPTLTYNYERSLFDFADLEGASIAACDDTDPNDPYPDIRNCPVFAYTEQGLGFLENRTNARTSGTIALTQRVKLMGYHIFKAGFDAELATYDATNRYTAGARYTRAANTATGAPGRWQLREQLNVVRNLTAAEVADPDSIMLEPGQVLCQSDLAICSRATDGVVADTTNRNLGAFIQDSWQIRPNFTLNLGLRWEQQIGYVADSLAGKESPEGEIIPNEGYKLDNMFAPRIGFIYDPTKEGRSKVFGHYGHFYENVPMDLNFRSYGGELTNFTSINFNRRLPTAGGYDPNCDIDHGDPNIVESLDACPDTQLLAVTGGGYSYTSPGMQGQRTDELVLGTEYEIMADLKLGITYQHRSLANVIEDVSVDGGNNYLITNPSKNFDAEAEELHAEAMRLMASADPKEQALGALYESRAQQLAYVDEFEAPRRDYDAIILTAVQRPTKASLLQASYTYSRSKGNYPGLFSTETGQLDPNITSLYDLPDLMANRYGPLGLDRPHNLKVDGFYMFNLKKAGEFITGASFRAQSGLAHNALGSSPHAGYEAGESYLLPRGVMQRSPVTSQLDIRLSYGYRLNKNTKLEGFLNVFNLFNSQEQLNQDENYTYDAANPVIGGTPSDLEHVKTLDPATGQELNVSPVKNKNFQNTGANNAVVSAGGIQQAPRAFQLGFRVTF